MRLLFTQPLAPGNLFGHLAATAVPGVEEWSDGFYRRTARFPHGAGIIALAPRAAHVECALRLGDDADEAGAVQRCRWLLDLDLDPAVVDGTLSDDPVLRPLVVASPGRRVPRMLDAPEFAIRAVLGQQISTAAARVHAARLVTAYGIPITHPDAGLTHLFPEPARLVELDPSVARMPQSRRDTLVALARALCDGSLDLRPEGDWDAARAGLQAIPGIGPWTVEIVAMRGLGDPDAFPASDLGVRIAAERLGLPGKPRELTAYAERWRPYRAYAVQHLWATLDHAVNRIPEP